jgi:nitronate monooxygenase
LTPQAGSAMTLSSADYALLRTPLCDRLGIDLPILQAGMGRSIGSPTTPQLVAAVSEAGGLGCLGASGLDPSEISAAIREVRQRTQRPFAVNVLLPSGLEPTENSTRTALRLAIRRDYPNHSRFVDSLCDRYGLSRREVNREGTVSPAFALEQAEAVIDQQVPALVVGLGDPTQLVARAHQAGMFVVGMAGSLRNAQRQRLSGVDAIVAQGYEAGGHTGTVANFALLPQIVDSMAPLPIIAAGGIADGRGLVAALAYGAQGVWCGTAFLLATETDLSESHRRQLIAARSEDMTISRCYTGKPSRIVHNVVVDDWAASGLEPLPMPYQGVLMDDFTAAAMAAERWDLVNNPGGQIAGMLTRQRGAGKIVGRMASEAVATIRALGRLPAGAGSCFPAADAERAKVE